MIKNDEQFLLRSKANLNFKNIMTKIKTTDFFVVCKESRIENNTSFYGCFYLGPFDDSLSQTLANDLRRTLLSELTGLAITSIEIEGVLHKFSNIPGMKESVLDLISNFQNLVLKKTKIVAAKHTNWETNKTKKTYTGFLNVNGPRVIKAKDLKLPSGLQCVDPNQYIATLAQDGFLNIKFNINEGKNFIKQKPSNLDVNLLKKRNILIQDLKLRYFNTSFAESNLNFENIRTKQSSGSISNPIPLDAVFMPVTKINCMVEENKLFTDFSTDLENNTSNFQKIDKNLFIGGKLAGYATTFKEPCDTSSEHTSTSVFTVKNQPAFITEGWQQLPAGKQDLNFADFFFNYTKNPQTCFVPTSGGSLNVIFKQPTNNPVKIIPWESNTLYFDLLKLDLPDPSEATNLWQPCEQIATKSSAKYLFWEFLKKNLNNDETTFNKIKIFLALNKRHLEKTTPVTQKTLINYKNPLNKSKLPIFNNLGIITALRSKAGYSCEAGSRLSLFYSKEKNTQKKKQAVAFKIKHEKLQHNLLLEYNKTLKLKPLRKKTHVIVEIWTNGSIHPREALYLSFSFLSNIFIKLAISHPKTALFNNSAVSLSIPFKTTLRQEGQLRGAFHAKKKDVVIYPKEKKQGSLDSLSQKLEREACISLKAPIGVLPISLRVYTALKKEGILTIEDLLKYTKKDLLKIKNFGVKSLFEVERQLSNLGYDLTSTC